MENLKSSTSMMEEEPMKMTCKGCQKAFAFKSIVQHVQKSKCSISYSQEEVSKLKERSKEISDSRKKLWNQQNKDKLNEKCRETYKTNQARIDEKRNESHEKDQAKINEKRHETYEKNQAKINEKRHETYEKN